MEVCCGLGLSVSGENSTTGYLKFLLIRLNQREVKTGKEGAVPHISQDGDVRSLFVVWVMFTFSLCASVITEWSCFCPVSLDHRAVLSAVGVL